MFDTPASLVVEKQLRGARAVQPASAHLSAEQPQITINRRDVSGFDPIGSAFIVSEGDTSTSVASKCGIAVNLLTTYNKGVDCAKSIGKPVCCSTGGNLGSPRDFGGVCYKYTIRGEDTCKGIAKAL
ncbi:hypothetical protein N7508_005036 [Penicillium antarcticum]|uniref:uncharacterized protein n=1 Tax=Penicillium antarcticum TaxID=416450 RepID=UPI0023828997|nr:uncharacterized protein N7508_005036 [Penicillium antarcticum]KAJ5306021.1 hypothetical protein N7508_005036 [Penicillium antarcticum]